MRSDTGIGTLMTIGLCLGCLCGLGCAAKAPSGWTVAYSSDFDEAKLPARWIVIEGDANVADGRLVLRAPADGQAQITLNEPAFAGSVRVEFDGSLTGDYVCDLSAFLNADAAGYAGGYLLQFGGMGNTQNRLIRAGEIIDSTVGDEPMVTPGKKHHVVAENDGGLIRLIVDGKELFSYKDTNPFAGAGHDRVGFYTWDCTLRIDKITIYTKKAEAADE